MTAISRPARTDHRDAALLHLKNCVADAVSSGKTRRILLVFGNGVNDSEFQKHTFRRQDHITSALRTGGSRTGDASPHERMQIWRYNEIWRDYSANSFPSAAIIFLAGLVREGLITEIVTPSYDLFINGLLRRLSRRYSLNPTSTRSNRWFDGYGGDPSGDEIVKLRKYHGDVGYARFTQCGCVFRLPRFPMLPYISLDESTKKLIHESVAELLHWRAPMHDHTFGEDHVHNSGAPDHYIDFNFPGVPHRAIFSRECDEANAAIASATTENTALILIAGFAGRWYGDDDRSSEEIVPALIERVGSGVPATMFTESAAAAVAESALAAAIASVNPSQLLEADIAESLAWVLRRVNGLGSALRLEKALRAAHVYRPRR